jgi:hypothetical protein
MSMKARVAISFAYFIVTTSVTHAELTPTVGLSLDYNGKYVWRGQNLSDDPAVQPGASIGLGNLTLGIWGTMDTTNINGEDDNFTEVDYTLDYSDAVPGSEILGYSVGLINYDFPQADTQTYEVYLGLSLDTFLNPSVTYYYDYDDVDSSYVSAGIAHSIADIFGEESGVSMDLSASLGWGASGYNQFYWGSNDSALNDLALGAAFPFSVGPVTVTPTANYVVLVDSDIKSSDAYDTDSDYFFAGIGVSMEF